MDMYIREFVDLKNLSYLTSINLNLNGLQGDKEWLVEISYLGELHHPNLVKLIGFCIEDDQRLLVYEYMCRGSLDKHLFRGMFSFQLIVS
ncbi:hypothetical protein Fmac_016756 [Flemingia macrophylla]|uniref:Protein kinase domain-containing protein n=1 Tax=Flemingia macrophylla TaxID=520843 RepID=A0ABD1MIC3_9FABA